jgi:hypothetical protein
MSDKIMARFNKASTLNRVLLLLEKLPSGKAIEILCHKRNRMVKILKKNEDYFLITERGFWEEDFEVEKKELRKLLKKLIKREFPRSHKLWVFQR